jgi:hypothetical protein
MLVFSLVLLFSTLSYIFGVKEILTKKYTPNLFSRIIWFLLSLNSLLAVIASSQSDTARLLAVTLFLGSGSMLIASMKLGYKKFGKLELVCTAHYLA